MVNNINAQTWLDKKYPINGTCQRDNDSENKNKKREDITKLDIRKGKVGNGFFSKNKNLIGSLKLEGFTNLRKLIVSSHQLTSLDVSDCSKLEELDCQSNELTNLGATNCPNLKKINCSNNNFHELDLSTCTKLEETNISNCPNLNAEVIKSNLNYDAENDKLVKGDSIKSSPRITKAENDSIRNILIVGITGNGKSALANTLSDKSNTNYFQEKSSSTSATKSFQESDVFEWQNKKYRIIDNIGFGDTNNISNEDILFKIGEGIHSAKDGINQVLFVIGGRFAPEHITAFNLFKEFIAESGITTFTTLVRTNFKDFRSLEKVQEDKKTLFKQTKELTEIINSCNGVIYVDNPAIPIIKETDDEETKEDKEDEIMINQKKRKSSREIVLNHLAENCINIYKLKEWDSIVSMVNRYNDKKAQIEKSDSPTKEKELKQAKTEIAKEISEGIKVSVGAEIPGLPVGLTAAIEYTKQTINW